MITWYKIIKICFLHRFFIRWFFNKTDISVNLEEPVRSRDGKHMFLCLIKKTRPIWYRLYDCGKQAGRLVKWKNTGQNWLNESCYNAGRPKEWKGYKTGAVELECIVNSAGLWFGQPVFIYSVIGFRYNVPVSLNSMRCLYYFFYWKQK